MANKVFDKKIDKHQDWGGDASTANLPVSGNRIQEFIKEQLDSKAGMFYYDSSNNRYIIFSDAESRDTYLADTTRTDLILGTFDAPFNYSAKITLSSATYVAILAETKNNYIDFTFDTMNKSGQSVGEDVICTYTFIKSGTKKIVTEKYRNGQAVHFKIDDYISTGTNTITVGIVGQNTLAATTVGITYQVVDLALSDTYDISQSYDLRVNPDATAAIPYSVSGYGTKIMEWYLDGSLLDYVKVEDEITDVSSTRTKYISLANLSQGVHNIQYRVYTIINGDKFYSNILYRDLIVITGVDRKPIIGISATIPVGNDIVTTGNLELFGITQYIPYELIFSVFNPQTIASTNATVSIDGKAMAVIQTHNQETAVYSLRPDEYGLKTLAITAGEIVYTLILNITKSSINLLPVSEGLQLDLMALGKSNNDVNREEWVYGLYSATFQGFNWNNTSGWLNNRLVINSGAYVDINISPLASDPTNLGRTLEFEFSTENVSDDDAVVCDLRNEAGTGLLITASEAILTSAGGSRVGTKFKSGENMRITFVINKKTGTVNKGLLFIYVNGSFFGSESYSSSDNLTSERILHIGDTTHAEIHLKALRFYNSVLSDDQVLNNYILYRDTTNEMLFLYGRNDIYEDGTQNLSVDKLAAQCPVFIFTGDIPALENTTDKNKTIYVDAEYINLQETWRSFTAKAIRLTPQGTSSMGLPIKNLRPYTSYGMMWDYLGNIIVNGLYSFADRAQPVNVWCLKADYAESSGTHNTGIARLWNQVMYDAQIDGQYLLRTAAQKAAVANNYPYDVRTTVDGFPVNVFYRLTSDSELVYIGKYNFNNDKSTESVFGFRDIPGFDNSHMQCWEVLNNGNHLALFQDMDNFDTEWDQAYEARYPSKSTNVANLKSFSEWVVSTKGNIEKFKSEKWQHLDVYKIAAYYIYMMRFGAVDQPVKNNMLTSEDGNHFFCINYDNDTIHGLRNDGPLKYGYDIDRQTIDTSFSALVYAYAGHDSTLWNNLEADDEFMRIVSVVDNALYIAGLSYEKTIDMFDNKQAGKWCERIYNHDARCKYIQPYINDGINNLFMLQGSRFAHRRWWLSHRFDLFDSKFVSGAYKAKSIEFKAANAPSGLDFSITAGNKLYFGYGLNNEVIESGIRLDVGQSHTFTSKQVINVGDPARIYSAVNIQELDIHNFIEYLSTLNITEVHNDTVGTKLKKLVMGVNTSTDSRRNTSLSNISGLLQAKRLEYLDISGYQNITYLDLSALAYFKVLKAYESGLTSVTFASGASVDTLELPDSTQTINFDNLPNLSSGFSIKNFGRNVHSIFIRNCSRLNTKEFIFNWNTNRLTDSASCVVTLDGISWAGVNADDLIALGSIKDAGGTLSLKGMIALVSVNQVQLNNIKRIFGNDCTNLGSSLYIKAPDGVFVTGPAELLEGNSAQYSASVFSDNIGTVEYYLLDGSSEVSSYNGVTIDKTTGFMTTTIMGSDRVITVRVKHIPTQGAIVRGEMQVKVNKQIFPSNIEITGQQLLNIIGNARYDLKINTSNVNAEYTTEWSLSGDAFEQGLVAIGAQYKSYCILNILSTPSELITFELKATLKKGYNNQVTATATYSIDLFIPGVIMTKKSNPQVLEICYQAGWCSSQDYMTEIEAKAVVDIETFFKSKSIKHFEEFRYFTGVTSFRQYAFKDCSALVSIVIPDGVTSIGSSAFDGCRSLVSIVIPDSVTSIDYAAFSNCRSLVSIVIPDGVTSIGNSAFSGCSSLASVVIPHSVTRIESSAYDSCSSLASISVDTKNDNYSDIEGVLFDKKHTVLCCFPNAKSIEYSIPDGVTRIGDYAFKGCSSLASIVIPDSVTSIGSSAFSNCRSLVSIIIPDGVTSIGSSAFYGCSSLASIVIPDSVTSIESSAFSNCSSLVSIIIPDGVTSIGSSAFYGCSSLASIVIPDSVTSIDYAAFSNCRSLVSITINKMNSPKINASSFGSSVNDYTGRKTFDKGTNMLYVPTGATGYDTSAWLVLLDAEKCGFTLSYTL